MSTQFITLDRARYVDVAGPQAAGPRRSVFPSTGNDIIRDRLGDAAQQEEKRRQLGKFLQRPAPAWNPDDHPDIDAAGGAAAWVRKTRSRTGQESDRTNVRPLTRPAGDQDFFKGKSLAELASEQGVGPVKDIRVFAGGIPDDADVDELVAQLKEMRAE